MSFSENRSRPENHPKEPSELDRQLDLLKSKLVMADLSNQQKKDVFLLISQIEVVLSEPKKSAPVIEKVAEPSVAVANKPQESARTEKKTSEAREAVEMGSEKALMDAWGAIQREYARDPNFSFTNRFMEVAKAVGWNVEPVPLSNSDLLVCRNGQKQQFVVFNPSKSFTTVIRNWFDQTSDSPNISGRMINWELIKPTRIADGLDWAFDVRLVSTAFDKGVIRTKNPA